MTTETAPKDPPSQSRGGTTEKRKEHAMSETAAEVTGTPVDADETVAIDGEQGGQDGTPEAADGGEDGTEEDAA